MRRRKSNVAAPSIDFTDSETEDVPDKVETPLSRSERFYKALDSLEHLSTPGSKNRKVFFIVLIRIIDNFPS